MSSYTRKLFIAAVAACALIAFISPSRAEEQKMQAAAKSVPVSQKHLK